MCMEFIDLLCTPKINNKDFVSMEMAPPIVAKQYRIARQFHGVKFSQKHSSIC